MNLHLTAMALILTAHAVAADEVWNPWTKRYERGTEIEYNIRAGEYQAKQPGDTIQYNIYEGKYEYAPKNSEPRYNVYEKRYELTPRDRAKPKYNTWIREYHLER